MVKTIKEGHLGKYTLRIVEAAKGLQGIAFIDAKTHSTILSGYDVDELWERLVVETGKQSAEYFGYNGAINRFREIFPQGFADPRYRSKERDYKIAAMEKLKSVAPLEKALSGDVDPETVLKAVHTNLLFKSESITMRDILHSKRGREFISAAAAMAVGDVSAGLSKMTAIAIDIDRKSWPLVTYLPFLWNPDEHMFLKPTVATGFADRVGHRFAHEYSSEIGVNVYDGVIDLTNEARAEISALKPADNVDVQSFIWAVAKYTDVDISGG